MPLPVGAVRIRGVDENQMGKALGGVTGMNANLIRAKVVEQLIGVVRLAAEGHHPVGGGPPMTSLREPVVTGQGIEQR